MPKTDKTIEAGQRWPLPRVTQKADGTPRKVGVEFELQGVTVEQLANIVSTTLGGTSQPVNDAEYRVDVPAHGEYRVEIDSALLKDNARLLEDQDADTSELQEAAINALGNASSLVVPCEVVSPPIPMNELAEPMDALVRAVREAGGQGTQQSPLYAFGVHLNIEPPEMSARQVSSYIKAFVCLYDWIVQAGDVDLMRRLMPYIRKFPASYESQVTDPGYKPDWTALIDDYLAANPTRNRALDMLPMFAEVDEPRVRNIVDDDLIKARPAFHYRLANCCIDDPSWSIADPWSRWLQIEHLAADAERLTECCAAFAADRQRLLGSLDNKWSEEVQRWLTTS
ncbi:MAG: amidoligase family protein [Gammaproteobacteria bacterium]|nr:amidoligase family protein [Gammaproteobacteria bacterium]